MPFGSLIHHDLGFLRKGPGGGNHRQPWRLFKSRSASGFSGTGNPLAALSGFRAHDGDI
jgi:hypothetical protein